MTETPEGEKRRKRTRTEGEGSKTRKKKEGGTVGKAKGKTPKMNHKSKEGLDSPEEKREKRTRKERKEKGSEKSQKKPREKKKPETNSNEDGEKPQTDVEKVQKDSSSKKERNSEKVKRKKRKEDTNDETKKDTTKKKKERKPKEEKVKEDKEEEVVEDKEDNKNEKSDDDKTKKKDEKEKEKEEKEDKNEDKEDEEDDEEKPKEKKKDNEESEKKENTKTNPEKKEPKEMTTEDLMALAEQKKKEAQAANNKPRNLTPIQQPVEEVQKEKRRFFGFGKKKKVAVVGGVIAGSVKHEGHAGFSSDGGLSTQGLPPQLAEFFEKLDELIRSLGYEGVTQQEVKFILKEYGSMLIPAKKPAVEETKVEVQEPTDPSKMSFEELLREYNTQNAVLSGLKATHTSIGTAKAKLKEEVEELNMLLASERENLKKQIDKNTHLEVENARLRAGGSSGSDNSDAFQALEDKMKAKFDEMAEKLAKEQEKTKQLQAKLDSLTDEQSDLLAQLGESQERAKQSRQALNSSKTEESLPIASTPPPPPPDISLAPPPIAPPLGNITSKPAGGGVSGGLDFGSVTLKKAETKPSSTGGTADLLAAIRTGTSLKKVEHQDKKPLQEEDEGNVLNLIAKALLDRRNGITMEKAEEEDDEWGDDDWED